MPDKKATQRIMATRLLPDSTIGPRALEYIAFYLCHIDLTLSNINRELESILIPYLTTTSSLKPLAWLNGRLWPFVISFIAGTW